MDPGWEPEGGGPNRPELSLYHLFSTSLVVYFLFCTRAGARCVLLRSCTVFVAVAVGVVVAADDTRFLRLSLLYRSNVRLLHIRL